MLLAKQPKYVGAAIGAGFGDEGKGLTTDYLIREHGKTGTKLVIRYNGGPQAGHTVETDDGKRHIFSHFGSGTFAGANTYFSKFCSVNPMLFNKEYDTLKAKVGTFPLQLVSHLCQVTTPWDMILNQNVEKQRSGRKHGSTGMGVGVTEDRRLKEIETPIGYLSRLSRNGMRHEFSRIRDMLFGLHTAPLYDYMGMRMDIKEMSQTDLSAFTQKKYMESFLDHFELMLERIGLEFKGNHLFDYDTIVFEGAQGLLLDERYGCSPYTTWSNTGVHNVVELCNEMGVHLDEITYITRSYGTRHGAGPVYRDGSMRRDFRINIVDGTNVPNPWQGHLETFGLDEKVLSTTINKDADYAESNIPSCRGGRDIQLSLMMTWAHLLDDPAYNTRYLPFGFKEEFPQEEWLDSLGVTHLAYGKTASSVVKRSK